MKRDRILFLFILFIIFSSIQQQIESISIDENDIEFQFRQDDSGSSRNDINWYSLVINSEDGNYQILPGKNIRNSIAWGYFKDDMLIDGWGKLSIETISNNNSSSSNGISEKLIFEAAGYLEGYLTWSNIYNFSVNYFTSNFNTSNVKEFPEQVINFITDNWNYMIDQVESHSESDPYWIQVSNAMNQLQGLYEGYNDAVTSSEFQLSFIEIYMLNLYGDIGDIITVSMSSTLNGNEGFEFKPMSQKELEDYMVKTGHCTALIRLAQNNSELYVAHTTWTEYSDMVRIYKRIKIPVESTPFGYETLFASYPGLLVSIDDFYMIKPSKLLLTETLNSILNQTLYSKVTSNSFMYWVRNLIANRLSNNGFEWVKYYVINNSGTNNIQFMIVDYKLFTPYQELQPGTLWIVEQYPGGFEADDVTFTLLSQGYWPSYNRPYSLVVFDIMGYPYYVNKYGDLFTYEYNPRALIFKRSLLSLSSSIQSIIDMQDIIEYNEYKTDPLSFGYPGNAIAARYDLGGSPYHPSSWFYQGAHGSIDGKVMSNQMFESYTVLARNGPPVTSECPPFTWSNPMYFNIPHLGMPSTFNFPWILIDL